MQRYEIRMKTRLAQTTKKTGFRMKTGLSSRRISYLAD